LKFLSAGFNKERGEMRLRLTLALIGGLLATPAVAQSDGAAAARGLYLGVFGGGGTSSGSDVTQRGTVFFPEVTGGPLAVNATGQTESSGVGLFGLQVGHEWSRGRLLAALELEGLRLPGHTRRANLANSTDRLVEQSFDDSFKMNNTVVLGNLVLSVPTHYSGVTPYIGGGIGFARVDIKGADSTQTNPAEVGINHFNSGTDSSAWTFAYQAKAGVRVAIGDNAYVFGEFRYLYVDATDQNFGSTAYPTHAPTTEWSVRFDGTSYYVGTIGIGMSF
jgi:opacity protein-like surface antigen